MRIDRNEPRFLALYTAIGKMNRNVAGRMPFSPRRFDVEFDWEKRYRAEQPFRMVAAKREVRPRPYRDAELPMEWVMAESDVSAEQRAQRLARLRAERELARERARILQMVGELRLAKVESELRQSKLAVQAMEEWLQSGGYTGCLGWIEAQAAKSRGSFPPQA